MRTTLLVLTAASLLAAPAPGAGDLAAEKRELVARNLFLTGAEEEVFWPLYEEHQAELAKLDEALAETVNQLAAEFATLTDERALELQRAYLEGRGRRLELQRRSAERLAKVLPGKKVVRYLQLENKLQMRVDYELSQTVPLVE